MLDSIPQNRLLAYLLAFGMLPILLALLYFQSARSEMAGLHQRVLATREAAALKELKQAANRKVKQYYADADRFYIDKHLESLVFLEKEIAFLKETAGSEPIGDNPELTQRMEFLTGSDNSLSFSEGAVQTFGDIQEVTATMVHPVELDATDLQKLLAQIEGVEIGEFKPLPARPQLLFLDFKIEKRTVSGDHEVFSFFARLLKREYQ